MDEATITEECLVIQMENKEYDILIGLNTINKVKKQKQLLKQLVEKYPTLFDESVTPGYEEILCEINTIPNRKVNMKRRKINHNMIEGTSKTIEKLLKAGYIEPSTSSWSNQLKPVMKPTGEVRITCNMQFLNNLVENNNYTIPLIQDIVEKTQGMKFFTVLDLQDGYFHIKIKPEDKHKTAFYFKNRLYQYTRMPQGFKNSPSIFQMIMDRELRDLLDTKCCVYLDDIIVFGASEEEHDANLEAVLKILEEKKFKLNEMKIQYKQNKIKLLGMMIDGVRKFPIEQKVKKVLDFQKPETKKELQSFIGFCNYYRKYIKNLSGIAAPLYNLLKGNSMGIGWNQEAEEAFIELKNKINKDISLCIPDFTKPFILTTDASRTGIGAALQQEINGDLRVLEWASKKLTPAETKYGITELEFYAMAWSIKYFDYYLRGKKFKVITDHTALKAMKTKEIFGNLKLERMRSDLQEYDFEIEYKKGSELIDADTISRIYETPETRENLKQGNKNVLISNDGTWYYKISENEIKIFPELKDRKEIIRTAHEESTAHGGTKILEYEIKKKYYWPKLKESISEYLRKCEVCVKNDQKSLGGEKFVPTTEPLEIVASDMMFIDQKNVVLTFIDYYTRRCSAYLVKSKESSEILKYLRKFIKEVGIPKKIVTDNGKEFCAKIIENFLQENGIEHHKVSIEKHQANGRIERLHRTIWQALRKEPEENLDEDKLNEVIENIIKQINNSYHRGIECTPNEAWENPNKEDLKKLNSEVSKYGEEFIRDRRENFNVGDAVYIQASVLESQNKLNNKYEREGIIKEKLENDSYLVEHEGKCVKKSHSQLKLMPKEI
jgi:hypothetical protein